MKKKILILIFISLIFINFSFAEDNSEYLNPLSPKAWGYFYYQIRQSSFPACAQGNTAMEKIISCAQQIANALKKFAAIIFVLSLVIIAGFFIFSPTNESLIKKGKTALLYTFIGFIIILIIDEILKLIQQLIIYKK
ncbi:MAG: hypothetical protein QXD43_05200 [Candidatus Aenigmatarchaeota archaeon]